MVFILICKNGLKLIYREITNSLNQTFSISIKFFPVKNVTPNPLLNIP